MHTFEANRNVFWCDDFHGDLGLVLVQHQVFLSCAAPGALLALKILIIAILGIVLVAV